MPNLMPFGKCLADILDREKVSINELTARIGYKSKTSLVRILKGEASAKSLEAFLVRFQASGVGEASDLAALGMALNVARMGKDRYLAWERLWGLFHGSLLACPDGGDV